MSTTRDLIKLSLIRLRRLSLGQEPNSDIAQHALGTLNRLIFDWAPNGVDVDHQPFTLDDTFSLLIPPHGMTYATISVLRFVGEWNASANTPALVSGAGMQGAAYRVTVSGVTVLDDAGPWSIGDFAIYDGAAWVKGEPAAWHEHGVAAMLATRLAPDFGIAPRQEIIDDAKSTFRSLLANFNTSKDVEFDTALTRLPSRRWPYSVPADTI